MQLTEGTVTSSRAQSVPADRQRDEVMKCLESAGRRPVAELSDMSDAERCKWLFWNLHQNLDAMRQMEPALQARVNSMQYSVLDESRVTDQRELSKRLDLACRWTMELRFPG